MNEEVISKLNAGQDTYFIIRCSIFDIQFQKYCSTNYYNRTNL